MQTTGTVVLNARGMRINGCSCLINRAPLTYTTPIQIKTLDGDPISMQETTCSTNHLKFGSASALSVAYNITQLIITGYPKSKKFTLSAWMKNLGISGYNKRETSLMTEDVTCNFYNYPDIKELFIYKLAADGVTSQSSYQASPFYSGYDFNAWHHYAFCRDNNIVYVFLDGVKYSTTILWEYRPNTASNFNVMYRSYNGYTYVDDLVAIDGECLWTSNFTPPSTYLLDDQYVIPTKKIERNSIVLYDNDPYPWSDKMRVY